MNIAIATKAIHSCISFATRMRNVDAQNKIMADLDKLSNKVDALIIRDLLAANKALDDIKATGVSDPAEISELRALYRKNTGLPIDGESYGVSNRQIVAMSYFGLLQIGVITGEDERRLLRYILHMFAMGEKAVAHELFPQFYTEVFSTYFGEVDSEFRIRAKNWEKEELLKQKFKLAPIISAPDDIKPTEVIKRSFQIAYRMSGMLNRRSTLEAIIKDKVENSDECKAYVQSELERMCEEKKVAVCAQKATEFLQL